MVEVVTLPPCMFSIDFREFKTLGPCFPPQSILGEFQPKQVSEPRTWSTGLNPHEGTRSWAWVLPSWPCSPWRGTAAGTLSSPQVLGSSLGPLPLRVWKSISEACSPGKYMVLWPAGKVSSSTDTVTGTMCTWHDISSVGLVAPGERGYFFGEASGRRAGRGPAVPTFWPERS